MSQCHRYQELIESCLAEEISSSDRAELDEHCAACAECANLLELHRDMLVLDDEITMPDKHQFREMRAAVLAATDSPRSETRTGFLVDLSRLWRMHPIPSGLATAAVLVCAIFFGRAIHQDRSLEEQLLQQTTQWTTAQQASLDSYWDAPYSFTNVSVRPRGQGQLALSFDASRHVDLQVAQDSPLAREVLLHAIMDPSSMGSRLRAMEATPSIGDARLKEALIVTMLNDPDASVRLNALGVLARYPYNAQSQDALLQTLGQDEDVQMRLTALEELARWNVGSEMIREAVGDDASQGTQAILREASISF
jgi:hypothetical protein